jgi:hypothetical protein
MRFLLRGFGFLSEGPADCGPESCPSAPVIRTNKEDAHNCFEALLPKDAKVEGKLYISFDIESDGKVANVTFNEKRSTYKNKTLAACLVEKAKKWRFPVLRTDETLQINYPFQLITADAAPQAPDEPSQVPAAN